LVSAENPIDYKEWTRPKIHPCKKNFSQVKDNIDDDYSELLNVQRHTKCNSAYCLRFDKAKHESYCRFNFPFDISEKTEIRYEKISSKFDAKNDMYRPVVVLKRNDPHLNRHSRAQTVTRLAG